MRRDGWGWDGAVEGARPKGEIEFAVEEEEERSDGGRKEGRGSAQSQTRPSQWRLEGSMFSKKSSPLP